MTIEGTAFRVLGSPSIAFSSPRYLGAGIDYSPYEWWRASRTDTIVKDAGTGAVTSWQGIILGLTVSQAVEAQRPIWTATGFNGLPVITFTTAQSHYLRGTSTVGLPSGATPCEMWLTIDQLELAAQATATYLVSYGSSGNSSVRALLRTVVSAVNRARATSSNTGTGTSVIEGTVNFSGRHVIRMIDTGTTLTIEIDGVAATPLASVPAIGVGRITFGATFANVLGNYASGGFAEVLITPLLTAAQASATYAILSQGVA